MFEFTFSVRMWNKKGLNLYSTLLTHQTGAYPGFHAARSDQEYHYSPLDGMLVHCKATPPSILWGFPDNLPVPIDTPGWGEAWAE